MAFHRYPITFAKLLIIAVLAYISLSGTGCNNIEGDKNMPFRDLDRNESLSTEIVNVKEYEAVGDGIKDDSSAITNAIAAASSSTLLLPAGTYRVGSNVIVPSDVTVWFTNGAKLSIDSGVTLALNGKLDAGLSQIFSGSGTVSIAKGSVEYLLPQWWGAVGDGSNDDTTAIQASLDCAKLNTKHVLLPPGIYKTTSALALSEGTWLEGSGKSDVTTIKVTGGGDGIDISRGSLTIIYEGAKVSDLRIYSTITPVAGVGIQIDGDRSVDIENVWVGSWYSTSSTYGYGFDKGIEIIHQPAYHTCIRRAYIFRCNYGVYINGGCNEARVLDGEIWYCGYGVYTLGVQTVRIINNSIEQFTTAGVYTDATEPIIMNNRFESSGIVPIILGTDCTMAAIDNPTNITGLGNSEFVTNNSGSNYHRIGENQYPIGFRNMSYGYAGRIYCNFYNYAAEDVMMESAKGDLKFQSLVRGKVIELQSPTEFDSSLNSPVGGFGDKVGNLFSNSSAFFNNWGLWGSGTLTMTDNVAVAPDGTLTAAKIVGTSSNTGMQKSYGSAVAGDIVVFSIWLRSDIDHYGILHILGDNTTRITKTIHIGTTWKRFSLSYIQDTAATNSYCVVRPGGAEPIYAWGCQVTVGTAITGTDNSGVNNKTTKLIDTAKNFIVSGLDIGGTVELLENPAGANGAGIATISAINSTISFDTGTGTEPAVGTTITGGTSTATGKVVEVVITGGTFAGGDATGYIEINTILGTFQTETITWSGGSVNGTTYYPNDVLRFSSLTASYGGKSDADNGDTYYACSSRAWAPKPFVRTTGTALTGTTSSALVADNFLTTGYISAYGGYNRRVYLYDPMTGNLTYTKGMEFIVVNPAADLEINYEANKSTFVAGLVSMVSNISTTYKVYIYGPGYYVGPGESLIMAYDANYPGHWRILFLGQSSLRKESNVSFKTVNGAVYPLVFADPLTCYMNSGDVFTLTTTGNCTINASSATSGTAGQRVTFIVTDDTTGGHVVTFGSYFKPSGTLTGTASKTATVTFVKSGSYWYEVSRTTGL